MINIILMKIYIMYIVFIKIMLNEIVNKVKVSSKICKRVTSSKAPNVQHSTSDHFKLSLDNDSKTFRRDDDSEASVMMMMFTLQPIRLTIETKLLRKSYFLIFMNLLGFYKIILEY